MGEKAKEELLGRGWGVKKGGWEVRAWCETYCRSTLEMKDGNCELVIKKVKRN